MTIYFLSVSTFRGMCPGAQHYYGRIYWAEDKTFQKSNTADVEKEFKKECYFCKGKKCEYCDQRGWDFNRTSQLSSEKETRRLAIKWFKKNSQKDDILVLGRTGTMGPLQILSGPPKIKKEANKIWKRADTYGKKNGYHGETFNKMYKKWTKIIES